MGYLTKEIFEKSTLFSILSIFGIILGIPIGIYGLTLDGGQSLAGSLVLVGVIVLIIILAIDRGIVEKVKPLKLSLIELILSIIVVTIYQYSERKTFVNLENYKGDYFVVIYNNKNLNENDIKSKFLFNKEIIWKKNFVVIPREIKTDFSLKVISPKKWNSLEMRPDSINGYSMNSIIQKKSNLKRKRLKI